MQMIWELMPDSSDYAHFVRSSKLYIDTAECYAVDDENHATVLVYALEMMCQTPHISKPAQVLPILGHLRLARSHLGQERRDKKVEELLNWEYELPRMDVA
ncbi:hypothetical protein BT96DRAFT_924049 [Gymnopus androsaceus JB14]|uniref:Uncharacterized protein n=1 Tax=Gymnopus androsaceus JB14 TaxID=1447944 RepID=A0A6A4H5N6_9AGAR|nr:hypothetical protein BT96DRAFT_924049 [Gymnopus androsaceus JB14]